jgi:tol-pal system protein YbgF
VISDVKLFRVLLRNSHTVFAVCLLGVLTACASTPPEQDPTYQKLSELDGRLLRIERVMTNQSLVDLAQRNEALQTEVRTLRGQVDELKFAADSQRDQQRELYADLERRLQAVEGGGGSAAASTAKVNAGGLPVPEGNDRANYQAAFDRLKDSKYDEAVKAFKQFLASFPDSQLADNAQYWLGESHYVMKDFAQAQRDFRTVLDKYPESRKLPDALLKLGYCDYELKNWKEARASLTQVVQKFSDTTAARLASQRLAKMESEGH